MLNHPEQVQPETKTHVLAVMESLNYHPNWFARGLNLGITKTIALLVPEIESETQQKIISGIETVAPDLTDISKGRSGSPSFF